MTDIGQFIGNPAWIHGWTMAGQRWIHGWQDGWTMGRWASQGGYPGDPIPLFPARQLLRTCFRHIRPVGVHRDRQLQHAPYRTAPENSLSHAQPTLARMTPSDNSCLRSDMRHATCDVRTVRQRSTIHHGLGLQGSLYHAVQYRSVQE